MAADNQTAPQSPRCPACHSSDLATGTLNTGKQSATIVIAGEPDGFLGVVPYSTAPVDARVCRTCGHIALFARSLETLLQMDAGSRRSSNDSSDSDKDCLGF